MTDIEKLSERRRWLLVVLGVSFLIWQLMDLEIVGAAGPGFQVAIMIAGTLAALVWIAALGILLLNFRKRQSADPAREALEDELVRANRRTAFAAGYGAMMLVAAGLFIASIFQDVITKDALNAVLVAGIVTPLFAFAWLEGRGG